MSSTSIGEGAWRSDADLPSSDLVASPRAYLWAIASYLRMSLVWFLLLIVLLLGLFLLYHVTTSPPGQAEALGIVMICGYGMIVAQTRNYFTTCRARLVPGLRAVHLVVWLAITAVCAAAMYPVVNGTTFDVLDMIAGTSRPAYTSWGVIGVTLCIFAAITFALQTNARMVALLIGMSLGGLGLSTLTPGDAKEIFKHWPIWENTLLSVGVVGLLFNAWELYRLNEDRPGFNFGRLEFSVTRKFDADTRRRLHSGQEQWLSGTLLKFDDWWLDRAVSRGARLSGWRYKRWALATPAFGAGRAVIVLIWALMFATFKDKQGVAAMTLMLSMFIAIGCLLFAHLRQPLAIESLKPVSRSAFVLQVGAGRLRQHLITMLLALAVTTPWMPPEMSSVGWFCFLSHFTLSWLLFYALHLWIAMIRSRTALVLTTLFTSVPLTLWGTITSLSAWNHLYQAKYNYYGSRFHSGEIELMVGMLVTVLFLFGTAVWRWLSRELND